MMTTDTQILSSPSAIAALRPQWDALWTRAGGSYVQSSTACLAAWQRMLVPAGARLAVVAGFEAGELVALWPLSVRRRGVWRVLSQAGPLSGEFSNVLAEPGPHADRRVASLWSAIGRSSLADLAIVPFVNQQTALGAVLAVDPRVMAADPDVAPYVAWRDGETWDAYYRSLSASYRKVQNKKRRQLLELGDLRFEVVSDPARLPGLIAWLLREKRVWADRANKRGAWIFSAAYEDYLTSLATEPNSAAAFVMFTLMRGDELVAAQFAMVGARHVDWITAAFAAPLARFSAGTILNEHCLKFALERGLTVESGAGNEENKRFWARNDAHQTFNYRIALNRWGAVAERSSRLAVTLRARLRNRRAPVADGSNSGQGAKEASEIDAGPATAGA